jgi:hypothetical protein
MTVTATPGTGRRHRVVAIGLGLAGLTATKALKHDLANITDALVFLTRITAQGTSHVNQKSIWLQVIPTTAAVLATLGVLVTLYVAIIRPRKRPLKNADTTIATAAWVTRSSQLQSVSIATDVCGVPSGLGKVGADHVIHRFA